MSDGAAYGISSSVPSPLPGRAVCGTTSVQAPVSDGAAYGSSSVPASVPNGAACGTSSSMPPPASDRAAYGDGSVPALVSDVKEYMDLEERVGEDWSIMQRDPVVLTMDNRGAR